LSAAAIVDRAEVVACSKIRALRIFRLTGVIGEEFGVATLIIDSVRLL
jgi:hypothetical protein